MVPFQHEVDGSGPRTFIPSRPFFQGVTPETPKLRSVRGDLEPTVTNGDKIVRALRQSTGVGGTFIRNDVPMEYESEDFGGFASPTHVWSLC